MGGFVGWNGAGSAISKCLSTGNITIHSKMTNIGRFVGRSDSGGIVNKCHYLNTSTIKNGSTTITPDNAIGEPKSRADLQSKAFLMDTLKWSNDIWIIRAGDYPCLAWES